MRVLSLNFGSSTLKYALFDAAFATLGQGVLERPPRAHDALAELARRISALAPAEVVAHRVVHGGPMHAAPVMFDAVVEREVEKHLALAPQHNQLALDGLRAARTLWSAARHVAVFDTAFHGAMPAQASCYAVPQAWRDAGVRRYGFHGLSHQYVMEACAARLRRPAADLRIVSCHVGNGASLCAIRHGRSVDTSMGLTPLEGLIMGRRSGDIDPGTAAFVAGALGLTLAQIEQALHAESGLAALAGHDGDVRRIEAAAAEGDATAELALQAYAYRIRKYIGAYAAAMGGCDVVAFTGGVGEHSAAARSRALHELGFLGLKLDAHANARPVYDASGVAAIHDAASAQAVLVVRAREEWMIAREAHRLFAS